MKPTWLVISLGVALCSATTACERCPFEQGRETPNGGCVCRYRPRILGESGPGVARAHARTTFVMPVDPDDMVALDPRFEENR